MGTIAEKLTYLNETKNAIKEAIVNKGVSVNDSDTFRSYADKISSIEAGGGTGGEDEFEASFMSSIDDSLGANVTKLPSGTTSIGNYAFYKCYDLKLTELPNSITSIGQYAFYECKKLALTKLPSGITSIGNYAFSTCSNLALTELPSNLTSIGDYGFYLNSELKLTSLPESLTSIGKQAFHTCRELALTKLPSNLTSIGEYAFYANFGMKIKEVPSGVTRIESSIFRSCTNLTTLDFKGNITYIGSYAFDGSQNLATVVFSNVTSVPTLSNTNAFSSTPIVSGKGYIYVPNDLVDSFKTASNWSTYANQIRPLSYLELRSIEIANDNTINTYNNNKTMNIKVTYNEGETNLFHPEQEGYTISVSGNATLDGNVLTLNDNAQLGEIITITVTSTYDTSISSTKEIEVAYREPSIAINLNEGQWVDSGTTVDDNIVYQSDAGSYNTNNGTSTAILTIEGYTNVKLYIRSFAEGNYDYIEAFAIDTTASRGNGLYTTKGKQSATDYVECIYELDGGIHTIEIMYSKDSGGDSGYDRGYFYIGECS